MMYRINNGKPEVLLLHPGGPQNKNKDENNWDIGKGEVEPHETNLLEAAKREFEEETGCKKAT